MVHDLAGLRVLHVVTLHTPENAFGGPTRVALDLAAGLRSRGADARLVALCDGYDGSPPREIEGVPVRLYRARHVAPSLEVSGITSGRLLVDLLHLARSSDLVHVHLMRDLVTLPAAVVSELSGTPTVLQTHGMVDPSHNRLAQSIDAVAMRRVLRSADAICYLTALERVELEAAARAELPRATRLTNGVQVTERRRRPQTPRVLFLARLQDRKRPETFVEAIPAVLARYPDARFVVAGPDSGARQRTEALAAELGVAASVDFVGGLHHEEALAEMARASVYVLPSVNEPFPVSVLEALSLGVPTVVTSSNGLAADVGSAGAGAVADDAPSIADAVVRLLEPEANDAASAAAHGLATHTFSLDAVIDTLAQTYADARARRTPRTAQRRA